MSLNTPRPRLLGTLAALGVSLALVFSLVGAGSAAALPTPAQPSVTGIVGADAITLTWPSVPGATAYRIKYSTYSTYSSPKYLTFAAQEGATQQKTVTGLTANDTLYFKVQTWDLTTNTETSPYSPTRSATTKYTFKTTTLIEVQNIAGNSIDLSWLNVTGAPGWRVRATASGKPTLYQDSGTNDISFKNLAKGTKYTFSVAVAQLAYGLTPTIRLSPYSSGKSATTSNYPLAAPTGLTVSNQQPYQVDLAWNPGEGMAATDVYRVDYARNASMTDLLQSTYTADTALTLTGLQHNTQYYVRVRVVTAAHANRSDRSDYALARTRIPWGTLTGKVTCVTDCSNVVVGAYRGGEIIAQIDVDADGTYSLQVRPTTYRVFVSNIGPDDVTSLWASDTVAGGTSLAEQSSVYTVPINGSASVPEVKLGPSGTITGVVTDEDDDVVRSHVDVAAITNTSTRQVFAVRQNDENGRFTLTGVPAGSYLVRFNYSGVGYKVATKTVTVTTGQTATVNHKLELNTSWYRPYGAYVYGTKAVGRTLSSKSTFWRPSSEMPFARADAMYVRWKLNGVAVTDWCRKYSAESGCSYKVPSSARGKYLTLQAKAVKVGYVSGYTTSKSYRIY